MKAALPGLLLLAALLVVPYWLQPTRETEPSNARPLVVLTSHNEAIRYEMARGFRRYRRERGEPPVRIDWRGPGGTSEISRILVSEYRAAFERYFQEHTGRPLSEIGALAFANPRQDPRGTSEAARARALFLASNVGIKVDLLFGGGSFDFTQHAAAGRLVDAGVIAAHPELFGEHGIPPMVGGEPYWDKQGRWVGACVAGFGICYNRRALAELGVTRDPERWTDMTDPRLAGHIALADPSKSGSANKAFEMIVQQTMSDSLARARGSQTSGSAAASPSDDAEALSRGFDDGLRLIRRIAGGSRYFADQATKVAQDVESGNAAIGTCIDFYGRFVSDAPGSSPPLGFVLPRGGSSLDSDPIGLLRGAPAPDLGKSFIEFVLSPAGQALWAYKRGAPGGPERYALRRTPILPLMFEPERAKLRSDPEDNPYLAAQSFTYHAGWTGPLFRALAFVIRTMCIDTEEELHDAAAELRRHPQAERAHALFDDVSLVSYATVKDEIAPTLASGDPLREVALQNRLVRAFQRQYELVSNLARQGK